MLSTWGSLTSSLRDVLADYPLTAATLILFFEELGIPSPIPSDVLMLLVGARAREGLYPYWQVILALEIATILGTTGLFFFSRRFGRAVVDRYGWLLHLGPETLGKAERAITKSGGRAIVIGRIIPGLRIVTPIAAGVLDVPLRTFLPAVSIGALIYIAAFIAAGALAGPIVTPFLERLALPVGAIASLAAVGFAWYLVRRLKSAARATGASGPGQVVHARIDGLLAGIAALLATNGVLGLIGFVTKFGASTPRFVAGDYRSGLHLLLGWPVFLIIASVLGAVDDWFGADRLPPRKRIALTAGVPLLAALVVVALIVRTDASGLHRGSVGALVLTEVLRWIAFGIALGELLPLDATLHELEPEPAPRPAT